MKDTPIYVATDERNEVPPQVITDSHSHPASAMTCMCMDVCEQDYLRELQRSSQLQIFTAADFSRLIEFTFGNNYLLFKVEMALHSMAPQKVIAT